MLLSSFPLGKGSNWDCLWIVFVLGQRMRGSDALRAGLFRAAVSLVVNTGWFVPALLLSSKSSTPI